MELAFNVGWSPISQIALLLIDVHSIVQPSLGAHSWWKARERCMSLVGLIQSAEGRVAHVTRLTCSSISLRVKGQMWVVRRETRISYHAPQLDKAAMEVSFAANYDTSHSLRTDMGFGNLI